jgi:hypothetical protein
MNKSQRQMPLGFIYMNDFRLVLLRFSPFLLIE